MLATQSIKRAQVQLAIAAGLLILACVTAALWWRISGPGTPSPHAVAKLDRLPARPEDIEAHGAMSQTVLRPDDARLRNASVPFADGPLRAAEPFAFVGTDADRSQAQGCLAAAVLYEAGDDAVGQAAVAQVVLNRVRHAAFPATVCGVVYQGAERQTGCQFTFTCDGSLRRTMTEAAWHRARDVAARALAGNVDAAVGLATHYHTDWVYPYWSPSLRKLARVGTHLFFGWPGSWGGPGAFRRAYRGREIAITVPALAADLVPEGGTAEDSGFRLPGLPVPPAKLPAGMGNVPLYGNKLRLSRSDGHAFGLLASPGAPAAKLVNAALALCGQPGPCQVAAWSNEDDIPGDYPIPAGARGTMVFEYVRDGGGGRGTLRFDCRVFPNKDPKLCMTASAGL